MQKTLLLILFVTLLAACKKNNTVDTPSNDPVNPAAPLLAKGNFSGTPGHSVSGTAEIINDNNVKKLVLKNFSATNGPDLKVYLSTNTQAGSFISFGALKSTSGQQVYDISGMPDLTQYKFVLIWCQQFSVLFGSAELQ